MSHFVRESTRQLTYFFLITLNSILSSINQHSRTAGGEQSSAEVDVEVDVAAILPPGLLGILLRCCLDPLTQHLAMSCCTALLPLFSGREGSRGISASVSVSGAALLYVEWCLQEAGGGGGMQVQVQQEMMMSPLLQELQALTLDVITQQQHSHHAPAQSGNTTATAEAFQLNKVHMSVICNIWCSHSHS